MARVRGIILKHHDRRLSPDSSSPDRSQLQDASLAVLLTEIGRRLQLRFGRVEIVFHDGAPSPKLTVEHRLVRTID